jgi:hypothetical protein
MLGAGGPGAEAGPEIVHSFDGGSWPAHEGWEGTTRATAAARESGGSGRVFATTAFTGCQVPNTRALPRTQQAPRHRVDRPSRPCDIIRFF